VRIGISFPEDRTGIQARRGSAPLVWVGLRALRVVTPLLVGRLLSRAGASALVAHHVLLGPASVRAAHARSAAVVAWTVRDPRDLARMDAAGVDAVVADDPTIFVSTLMA
jgi:glycerophosphoryl diester phosphodiesterase